jgi:aryl-alcohol dehydrogenase-like predicted oxidoreductase
MTIVYRNLGKSGLKVSPFCLGTMTFGGSAENSEELFNHFIEHGGNFIDTADMYNAGKSEKLLGRYIKQSKRRDEIVLASKYTFNANPNSPNMGGNSRKNMRRALEGSLERLQTDFLDLYIMHTYDLITPIEEVARSFNDLISEGKILHYGLSDVPAWYAARFDAICEQNSWERPTTLQLEYSLLSRNLEREHLPLAREVNMSITPWSPLGAGLLTGKYKREESGDFSGEGRLQEVKNSGNPIMEKFSNTEKFWEILDEVLQVAKVENLKPVDIALGWLASREKVDSIILGATKLAHLKDNISACLIKINNSKLEHLDNISSTTLNELDHFFQDSVQKRINGTVTVTTN